MPLKLLLSEAGSVPTLTVESAATGVTHCSLMPVGDIASLYCSGPDAAAKCDIGSGPRGVARV